MGDRRSSAALPAGGHHSTVGGWLAAHPDLARRDLEVLLCRRAGLTRAQVLARPERELAADLIHSLDHWAERRRRGEPVAYILGEKDFWGMTLLVNPAVLVPRPETELLVESALDVITRDHRHGRLELLELGTGSGAVAIALARELAARCPPACLTATDLSAPALAVAAGNARRHQAAVRWLRSDWFAEVTGRYHLIVSNPPYVASADPHLSELGHEPAHALAAGPDGLDAIRVIVAGATAHLEPGGWLLLEHGFDQGPAVRELMEARGLVTVTTLPDLAGLDRVTRGRLPAAAASLPEGRE